MSYTKLDALEETGYVVLDRYDQAADPQEWLDITYVDWKSSGDTRFAPLASAYGDLECNGFWHHDPPKTDKDGVWVEENVEKAPILKARAEEPGSNIGRCRVIELKPNDYVETVTATCTSTTTTGSTPRAPGGSFEASSTSRTTRTRSWCCARTRTTRPPSRGSRCLRAPRSSSTPSGSITRLASGGEPRYCLITSWESGPELEAYITKHNAVSRIDSPPVPQEQLDGSPRCWPSAPPPPRSPPAPRSCPRPEPCPRPTAAMTPSR